MRAGECSLDNDDGEEEEEEEQEPVIGDTSGIESCCNYAASRIFMTKAIGWRIYGHFKQADLSLLRIAPDSLRHTAGLLPAFFLPIPLNPASRDKTTL